MCVVVWVLFWLTQIDILNQKNLHHLKKGVYIVNTSRGPVLEEKAIVEGLRSGLIAGAGLDVLESGTSQISRLCSQFHIN